MAIADKLTYLDTSTNYIEAATDAIIELHTSGHTPTTLREYAIALQELGIQGAIDASTEGSWYILSPANMFTDRAGTTPVTALDDVVGLIMDSSQGQELGAELVAIQEPTVAQLSSSGGNITDYYDAGDLLHQQWVEFVDNAVTTYAYLAPSVPSNVGRFELDVWMLDADSPPSVGGSSSPYNMGFTIYGSVSVTSVVSITKLEPYRYRLTVSQKANTGASANLGIVCYSTNTFRPFRVSGWSAKEIAGNHFQAVSDAGRALYKTDGTDDWFQLDKVDDNYSTTFASPIVGTMLIGTRKGTMHIEVDIPAGAWSLTPTPNYFPGDTITDIIIKDGYMTTAELANAKAWLASRGSPVVYTPDATDLIDGLREWGTLTSVTQGADLSNVTNFGSTFRTNQITSIPTGLFDNTPNVTNFYAAFYNNLITSIPIGLFDNTPNVTNFGSTFRTNQITSIPTGLFDFTPNVTNFSLTFYTNQITAIPTGLFDNTPNVTDFSSTFRENTTLTAAPAGLFDSQTVCTNYTNCFLSTALDQTSIDNVLVSIANSYTTNGLTGGQFDQSGGSAPSATGQAAIDTLRAAGMLVTVTGGY